MIKRLLFFTFAFFSISGMYAQNAYNLILFNQEGNAFTTIINGARMNEQPVTNLKLTDLTGQILNVKIIFDDPALGEFDKKMYPNPGMEASARVMQNKKGSWVLRYQGEVPIAQAPPPPPNQQVIVYSAAGGINQGANMTVTEETVTTTTTTGGAVSTPTGESVTMGVSVDGMGMGMNVNVNVNDGSMGSSSSMTTTSTTTTTTTTSSSSSGAWGADDGAVVTTTGCFPMDDGSFQSACGSIRSKSFADSKMTVAKQVLQNNCMSAAQIRQMANLFDFESDKLDFAKYAWHYCADPNNYFQVNDAFEFESTIEELDMYIQAQR